MKRLLLVIVIMLLASTAFAGYAQDKRKVNGSPEFGLESTMVLFEWKNAELYAKGIIIDDRANDKYRDHLHQNYDATGLLGVKIYLNRMFWQKTQK